MTLNLSLQNKTILITGGTSRLGEAAVRQARKAGAEVFFTYHQNKIKADELSALGAKAYPLNLSSAAAIDDFSKALRTQIDHLDVLIHNAAAVRDRTIQNLSEEDWDEVMSVNLKAPYYLTKKLLPILFKRKRAKTKAENLSAADEPAAEECRPDAGEPAAKIFFITSRAAVTGGFGISNYAAAKAGLIGLTKSLAQELGKKNILVNAVNPGFMLSRMTENLPREVLQHHLEVSPIHRHSNPEEVADFLIYMCSGAMTQVTGQIIHFESRKNN